MKLLTTGAPGCARSSLCDSYQRALTPPTGLNAAYPSTRRLPVRNVSSTLGVLLPTLHHSLFCSSRTVAYAQRARRSGVCQERGGLACCRATEFQGANGDHITHAGCNGLPNLTQARGVEIVMKGGARYLGPSDGELCRNACPIAHYCATHGELSNEYTKLLRLSMGGAWTNIVLSMVDNRFF